MLVTAVTLTVALRVPAPQLRGEAWETPVDRAALERAAREPAEAAEPVGTR